MSIFSKLVRKVEKKVIKPIRTILPKPVRKVASVATHIFNPISLLVTKPQNLGFKSKAAIAKFRGAQATGQAVYTTAVAVLAPFAAPFVSQGFSLLKPKEPSYEYSGDFGTDTLGPGGEFGYPSVRPETGIPYAAPSYPSGPGIYGGWSPWAPIISYRGNGQGAQNRAPYRPTYPSWYA